MNKIHLPKIDKKKLVEDFPELKKDKFLKQKVIAHYLEELSKYSAKRLVGKHAKKPSIKQIISELKPFHGKNLFPK